MTPHGTGTDGLNRPPRWPVLVSIGTLLSGVLGNTLSDQLSSLAGDVLGRASIAVAVLGGVASVAFEVRRRRRGPRYRLPEPTDTVSSSADTPTLPYPAGFTGRTDQVSAIRDAIKREHAVAVLGRRAVGTSSCAVQAANLCREDFPDGQFYLDLRARGRRPRPREVLTALARILGTAPPPSSRQADLTAAADAVRSQLDGREILLVLDNVDDPDQVRPLLPPAARTCRLLLAGAPGLAGLEGVSPYWLDEPDTADAVQLFAASGEAASAGRSRRSDPRTDPVVRRIVELCGRQPRTIRALGYRAARHGWRSVDLHRILRRAVETPPHQRIPYSPAVSLLTDRDTAYAALSPGAKRVYRLMSLGPAALDRPAIAALANRSAARISALVDELATAAFVVSAPGDRYEIRPLLAAYARLHLRDAEPGRRRVAAQARLARHLARHAERYAASLPASMAGAEPGGFLSLSEDPGGWFELHQDLLRGVVSGPAGAAEALPWRVRRWWFRLSVALCGWYAHDGRLDEWAEVCRTVLATPTAGDRPRIAGWAHNELGVLHRRRGDPYGAADALNAAVAERRHRGGAQSRYNLGLALLDQGLVDEAIEHLEVSRRHRSRTDRAGHALTDLGLGAAQLIRDEPERARHHLVRAANAFRSLGDARGYAAALTNLILVHNRLNEHLDAAQTWRAALREYETVPDPPARATALLNAGAVLLASAPARVALAEELLDESRRLREAWPPTAGLGRTLLHLGDAARERGRPDLARQRWARAAEVCAAVGDRAGSAAADGRLG
ncbi:tetratricopeptide repeat protein [Plantactinospora sp. KBS50]|uniref:tetratricopeptide repeat protein n=1 Tax=Plantactinospora sp. KBS50 TaxID=2024580 RepID=UPI000BAAC872|nr:tetratricopeptide repeat protein [Plantactinospora sp. KBS50]ASW55197.1 hypothetical protein CIK06_14965 [Plantactinospora sp. KBS50]